MVQFVAAPLGFYVLLLLIVESSLALVLTVADLDREQRWSGFLWMVGLFVVIVFVVTALVVWLPKHLVFGKEEHARLPINRKALSDQILQSIVQKVKAECLKADPK